MYAPARKKQSRKSGTCHAKGVVNGAEEMWSIGVSKPWKKFAAIFQGLEKDQKHSSDFEHEPLASSFREFFECRKLDIFGMIFNPRNCRLLGV